MFLWTLPLFYFSKLPLFNPLPTSSPVNQCPTLTYYFRFTKNLMNTK